MTERADPTPVALCARVSSERHDVDLSVSAQLRALRDYAAKNGHLIAREYVDEAESGRVADRPQFRRMLDEATGPNAPFEEILVWKFSRFTRKREHAVAFESMLRRRGVRVVSITEHADDSPTGSRRPGTVYDQISWPDWTWPRRCSISTMTFPSSPLAHIARDSEEQRFGRDKRTKCENPTDDSH